MEFAVKALVTSLEWLSSTRKKDQFGNYAVACDRENFHRASATTQRH
jgi:hypothetical protein